MIEVSRLQDLNAAQLFFGFRIGAIGRHDFAVFPVQGQCGLRRLKRQFGNQMSVGPQMVVVLKAFVQRSVSLVLGHPFEFSWLEVAQTDVFHSFSSADEETGSECGPVHPPYAKPPLVSSSGPPGACMTPSRETNSSTLTFLMIEFLSTCLIVLNLSQQRGFRRFFCH